ncbi:MAG TPA: hydroxymethylglutaryl-CoA lyase [Marmoricola sp.]|nr:hydroxymethylglutaryl-CoA lyase [Marmoricola sp.]
MSAAGPDPRADVEIVEVGPRDGLQNEAVLLGTDTKLELIARAVAAGVRRIEATSFVHPRLVPQLADAEEVMAGVERRPGVRYAGLVLNARGLDRALAAGVDEINCVVVATETFSRRNQGMSVAEAIDVVAEVARARAGTSLGLSVTIAVSFGCPFEGEVDPAAVVEIARQVAALDVDEISLADTIGVGVPAQVAALVGAVHGVAPDQRLRTHFHNTRNTGYANAVAAQAAGVDVFDSSLGGIGGCPFAPAATGNIATEDLVNLFERSGLRTGLDLDRLLSDSAWLGGQLGAELPGLVGRAGVFPGGL